MFVIEIEIQLGGQAYSFYAECAASDDIDGAIAQARSSLSSRDLRWARFVPC